MGDVQNNSVEIQGGTFSANYDVYEGRYGRIVGGWSENGDVISNKVQISGGTFGRNMDIMGGRSTWDSNQMQLFAYNSVEIDGTNNVSIGVGTTGLDSPNIYGAYATIARAKNNTVTITNLKDQGKGQKFQTIVGTFLDTGSEAVQNGVEISNSEFAANAIAGVQTGWGSSEDVVDSNYVRIQNSTIRLYKYDGIEARISGSDSGSNNETSGNTVIIENSTISNTSEDSTAYITAAHTAGGDVHDNVVYLKNVSTEGNVVISGGSSTTTEDSYTGNIYTGHVYSNHVIVEGSDNDLENAILLGGDNDLEDAILLGGLSNDSNYISDNSHISDNSLHLVNFSGKVGAIDNFDTIVFSDIEWKEDTTVLTITKQANTDLSNTTIRVENIIFGTTVSPPRGSGSGPSSPGRSSSSRDRRKPMKFLPRMLKWRRWNPPGKPVYLLCASAYAAGDYAKMGLFRGKAYKWGYFPQTLSYDRESLLSQKEPGSILWAGRFLDWKHPDDAIRLAARLRDAGHAFTLRMAGSGPLEPKLHQLIAQNGLDAQVRLLGSLSPEQVRREMERSAIFLFTSDRYEGWGAVLNEAMNSGCAVVASDAAGSTPYLVNDGVNGCVYPSGNGDELYGNAARLLAHPSERERMGKNAYETITDTWNAQAAAGRLCELIWAILAGDLSPRSAPPRRPPARPR